MSFSRIKYDDKAYDLKLDRSVAPGDYRLTSDFNENCEKCYSYDGPKNAKSDIPIPEELDVMTDVESHLTNRINKLIEYNEYGQNDYYKNIPVKTVNNCDKGLIPEDTRFSYPLEAYRCMDVTSLHYTPFIYSNLQCEYQEDRLGLSSRIFVKDRYVLTPQNPKDQKIFLPDNADASDFTYNGVLSKY